MARLDAAVPVLPAGAAGQKQSRTVWATSLPGGLVLTVSGAMLHGGLLLGCDFTTFTGVGGLTASQSVLKVAALCEGCSSLYCQTLNDNPEMSI